ncbi:MAG: MmcQ/YjbR family DNA-binding protein [Erysipelotrichales bacterium]|nr:MmcQ/YjbR family DNA-binding protein [Erysipelotrichales bacterium]
MKRSVKYLTSLILTVTGILFLSACSGHDNFIDYVQNEWRWWNFLLLGLLILLVIFSVLLIYTMIRHRRPVERVVVNSQSTNDNKLEDVVNKVTEETLSKSILAVDPAYKDCKVPLAKTNTFTIADIDNYISDKKNIEKVSASGKKPTSFKVKGGKSFCLLFDLGDGKYKVTLKCGPAYGAKLCEYFKDLVTVSKFPYGIIWFSVSNETKQPSLELIKQMVDISYEIAKIGH